MVRFKEIVWNPINKKYCTEDFLISLDSIQTIEKQYRSEHNEISLNGRVLDSYYIVITKR